MKKTMKKALFLTSLIAILTAGLVATAAEPVSHKEGRMIGGYRYVNDIGRPYLVESILFAPNGAGDITNTITVKLINTQNTDLTGTNATQAAVTFTLGSVSFGSSTATSLTPTVPYMIPDGATLLLTNNVATVTNDFILIRKEKVQ
jgi:hypothetical protein